MNSSSSHQEMRMECKDGRGGLTIRALGHCPRPEVRRGPHEMPLVPFHRLFWVWFECG
ncbi:unnamed protein product [Staurois parvus]|uniref:Uncharacterized protein n=1 Tax=Staurois parvus TaxID=386267 RepID=A0ABN9BNR4_9NEOB|nr:unnamed protein product [Staurois parvus]